MVERQTPATEARHELEVAREWLREYSLHSGVEILSLAEEQMLRLGVSLLDVNYVLANGQVTFLDTVSEGCVFMIAGETCDELVLEIAGCFASGHMFLRVESVTKIG